MTQKKVIRGGSKIGQLFQFKIVLKDTKPLIWRQLQVANCTLDKLHEHIQTAMGWTNSHLHRFEVAGRYYGDPELLEEDFDDSDCADSTVTRISELVPVNGKPLRFNYEYDFGDGWQHEVVLESCPPAEAGQSYPLCLEGAGACPPEDIGGVRGYAEFRAAIADPKHKRHAEMLEWIGPFDPAAFNAADATNAMQKGLPDWRNEEDEW